MGNVVKMKVEIPKNSRIKYEVDKDTGEIVADRLIHFPYPENYGYVPDTLADDGDPLDIFLMSEHEFAPGSVVEVVVIGMVEMWDNDEKDNKLIAVFDCEGRVPYQDLKLKAIRNFLTIYKADVFLGKTADTGAAVKYLKYTQDRYEKKKQKV